LHYDELHTLYSSPYFRAIKLYSVDIPEAIFCVPSETKFLSYEKTAYVIMLCLLICVGILLITYETWYGHHAIGGHPTFIWLHIQFQYFTPPAVDMLSLMN